MLFWNRETQTYKQTSVSIHTLAYTARWRGRLVTLLASVSSKPSCSCEIWTHKAFMIAAHIWPLELLFTQTLFIIIHSRCEPFGRRGSFCRIQYQTFPMLLHPHCGDKCGPRTSNMHYSMPIVFLLSFEYKNNTNNPKHWLVNYTLVI